MWNYGVIIWATSVHVFGRGIGIAVDNDSTYHGTASSQVEPFVGSELIRCLCKDNRMSLLGLWLPHHNPDIYPQIDIADVIGNLGHNLTLTQDIALAAVEDVYVPRKTPINVREVAVDKPTASRFCPWITRGLVGTEAHAGMEINRRTDCYLIRPGIFVLPASFTLFITPASEAVDKEPVAGYRAGETPRKDFLGQRDIGSADMPLLPAGFEGLQRLRTRNARDILPR
ncbi:hypothetical protein CKAH01_11055 [Colletotrichum kahawae]|uniref:Uncharacterized protein n=1 Tax=Colletotrichum kahawae TaxID=34407 RepID=A0AAE0CY26_COLKA|nr:hypothetical protein CKAH01_11055 [Colletotrichum kahawae]